jgi:large subunit ribosomal protein MRP49
MLELSIDNQPLGADHTLHASDFAEWSPIELACAPLPGASAVSLRLGGEDLGLPATSPFDPTWRWRWLPRGVAGEVRGEISVTLADGTVERRMFALNLRPRLLDSATWAALLDDTARLARGLAVSLGGAAFALAMLVPLRPDASAPLEEALALLERHSRELVQVVRTLNARPESTLRPVRRQQPLGEIQAPDPAALTAPVSDFDLDQTPAETPAVRALRARLGGALPRSLAASHAQASADLPEHRWLVGLIGLVERRLRSVRTLLEEAQARQPGERLLLALRDLGQRTERTLGTLRRLRELPPLAGLPGQTAPPSQSQRLVRDQRYRPLRRIWRELREAPLLTLEAPMLALPIADLPTLYEQWCALIVAEALLSGGATVIAQNLLAEDPARERWTVQLTTAAPLLELQAGAQIWRLRYQARYTTRPDRLGLVALDAYTRIPDLVLELIAPGQPPSVVVLDAKYRRAPDRRVPQDALDDAYAYRGSIGQHGSSAVRYAAILYPHHGPGEDFGSVGAIPLLPRHTAALHELLQKLMR